MSTRQLVEINRLLAREETILRIAFNRFVRKAKSSAVLAQMTRMLRRRDITGAVGLIDGYVQEFADELPRSFIRVAKEEMKRIRSLLSRRRLLRLVGKSLRKQDDDLGIDLSFDPSDEEAAILMERSKFEFFRDFSAKQKRAVRTALARGLREGESADAMARVIRDTIGLTETQWNAVENYRNMLEGGSREALNRQLRDRRFDSTVSNAITRGDILEDNQIERMVDRYTDRMVDYRARIIARTESHRVSSAARNNAWRQTARQLGLDDAQVVRTWHSSEDDRVRETHAGLDGQQVVGFEPFQSSSGASLRYPGDPDAPAAEIVSCRCAESYDFVEAA